MVQRSICLSLVLFAIQVFSQALQPHRRWRRCTVFPVTEEEVPFQDLALYVIGGKFALICDDFAVGENYDVASYDFVIDTDKVCALAFHFPTMSELFLPFRWLRCLPLLTTHRYVPQSLSLAPYVFP